MLPDHNMVKFHRITTKLLWFSHYQLTDAVRIFTNTLVVGLSGNFSVSYIKLQFAFSSNSSQNKIEEIFPSGLDTKSILKYF